MRVIQKEISLEPMTSRLPSVWPSYFNNDGKIYYFDEDSLVERQWLYTCNWGMTPLNIVVNHNPNEIDETTDEKLPINDRKYKCEDYKIVSGCHCYGGNYEVNVGCSNSGSSSYDTLCNFVLSFESLSKWYHFFTEYYNLLKRYGHCGRVYTSAEDYYNYESLTKYASQMVYGSDKQTYLDLDNEFYSKGGRVEVKIYDKDNARYSAMTPSDAHDEFSGDRMSMADVYDVGFFKWICENVVPSFTIPNLYKDYWKREVLFYPDVVKWLKWFEEKVNLYDEDGDNIADFELERGITEIWNCKESAVTDCCECEEYFNRGGSRIYSAMNEWYETVQECLDNIKSGVSSSANCFSSTIILPTELQLSIDDLGEFSIFSKDYELGEDYRVAKYGENENKYQGTVANIDNIPMLLTKGCGYTFNEDYMEKYASLCKTFGYVGVFVEKCPKCGSKDIATIDWTYYTEHYITNEYECGDNRNTFNHKNEFEVSAITYYTYDENNVKYTSSAVNYSNAINELKAKLTKKYPLTKNENGWILIYGVLYPINETEYGIYDENNEYLSGKTYLIFRENGTNTPYTYVNGKMVFADLYLPKNVYYFPMFKSSAQTSGDTFNIENYKQFERYPTEGGDKMYYIEYNGSVYNLGDNTATSYTIDDMAYYKINAYSNDDNGETLYCHENNVYTYGGYDTIDENDKYSVEGYNTPIIKQNTIDLVPIMGNNKSLFTIYKVDEITGHTVSKFSDLRLYNTLTDNIGNTIEAIYDVRANEAINHQPQEGAELELIYQVGNTANINRFSQTKEDVDDIVNGTNYFVGDILTNMTFYYKDVSNNIVSDTIYYCEMDSGGTKNIYDHDSNLSASTISGYTSLSAITLSSDKKKDLEEEGTIFEDDIYCDVTYYIGATLFRKNGKPFNLAKKEWGNSCYNYGVEYTETVKFVKTNWEYYLKKPLNEELIVPSERNNPCKHSISYPIYIYVLTQNEEVVENSQYDSLYSVPMADFKAEINIFSGGTDTYTKKYANEMLRHNNLEVYPTYREEYRLGISTIENVDSDIYIDRGINAAFEKHLKLSEVKSLDALKQYGNSYFKIIDS